MLMRRKGPEKGILGRIKAVCACLVFVLPLWMSLLAPLLIPLLMPVTAQASESREILDPDRLGSIRLKFTYWDEKTGDTYPVSGGNSVGLYRVAYAEIDNGFHYVLDERFDSVVKLPSETEELEKANLELAEKLAAAAKSGGYDFDKAPVEMDQEGEVFWDGLPVGLYLVVQDVKGTGDNAFTILPFLISVPNRNPDGSLNYDVNGESKPLAVYFTSGGDDPVKPDRLPQTGQLWWPVMVLVPTGVLLVLVGLYRRYRE